MFSSKTGWVAVLVSLLGALTATDTLPMVTTLLTSVAGAHTAQAVGTFLTVAGAIIAKLSHSMPPVTTVDTPSPPSAP